MVQDEGYLFSDRHKSSDLCKTNNLIKPIGKTLITIY